MKIIHIAGTNGKGSIARYTADILSGAGYRCALYTSPHVISREERISIDGQNIPKDVFNELIEKYGDESSVFAAYTYCAMEWFERNNVDFAVLETGMGGRLDPTNEFMADVKVIAPISFDHTHILGNTLSAIAKEKCGIIKNNTPTIVLPQQTEALLVIQKACAAAGSELIHINERDIKVIKRTLEGQVFEFGSKRYNISSIAYSQIMNACAAICAAQIAAGKPLDAVAALSNVKIQARAQYIKEYDMIVDGAHNEEAILSLWRLLDYYFADRKLVFLCAAMADKDISKLKELTKKRGAKVYATQTDSYRALSAKKLAKKLNATCYDDCEQAFAAAREYCRIEDAVLVITGSFYLAGNVLNALKKANHKGSVL